MSNYAIRNCLESKSHPVSRDVKSHELSRLGAYPTTRTRRPRLCQHRRSTLRLCDLRERLIPSPNSSAPKTSHATDARDAMRCICVNKNSPAHLASSLTSSTHAHATRAWTNGAICENDGAK